MIRQFSVLGLTALTLFVLPSAYADPDALKPATGSEMAVMNISPMLNYGSFGPQTNLGATTFETLPKAIYIEKTVEENLPQLGQNALQLQFNYAPVLNMGTELVPQEAGLDAEKLKMAVSQKLDVCQKTGKLCDAVVKQSETVLLVEINPVALESVEINAKDEWQESAIKYLLRQRLGESIELKKLQRQLRLIQTNPDISLKPSLEVIPYTHQAKLVINSEESSKPIHAGAYFNNLGQPAFSNNYYGATMVTNNVFGLGDSFMLAPIFSNQNQGIFSRYELPLSSRLKAYVDGGFTKIRPIYDIYNGLDIRGTAWRVSPGLKYVAYDDENTRVTLETAFDFKEVDTESQNDKIEDESIRVLRFAIQLDQAWEKTALTVRNELAFGLPILGGSLSGNPLNGIGLGGSQFTRITGWGSLVRQMPWESSLALNAQWQYTPDVLPSTDVYGTGGTFNGRGYREVFIFTDNAAIVSLQYQYPMWFIPKTWKIPFTQTTLRDAVQMVNFVDYAFSYTNNQFYAADQSEHLLSTGVGWRVKLNKYLAGRLDIGLPILRNSPFSGDARIHFGLDVTAF